MLTKHTHLYTEMVADNAVIHGRGDLITFDPAVEEPLTMQLGGYVAALHGGVADLLILTCTHHVLRRQVLGLLEGHSWIERVCLQLCGCV